MEKDTQLRTKQTEVIRDLKRVSAELSSIKGIITSGVVSSEILKADEALHENLDKIHTLCDFIIEFYNSTEPAKLTEVKEEIKYLREQNAENNGTIFDLKNTIAELKQESLENKTKIEQADSALDAFKDPEGFLKSMDDFYKTVMENEDLAKQFFELDDVSGGDDMRKKVAYSVKLLEKVLVDGIDLSKKLNEKFNEYNEEIGNATIRVTDEKSRADQLKEELKTRIASLEQLQEDYEKEKEEKDILQDKEQELTKKISGLNDELVKEKEHSENLNNQLQSETQSREMAENYLERLGIAYETLREIIPADAMQAIDDILKSNEEGAEEIVQELILGSVVGKEKLEEATKKYDTLQDAIKAILGDELLEEYEGMTEEQNPYLWLMQTHQDLFVEKAKSDEQLKKAAEDMESTIQEHQALEQGIVHTISLLTENPDVEKMKEDPATYLKEKIEELKQENDDYKGKAVDLEAQVKEKEEVLRKQEEESASQKESNAQRIQELESQLTEKEQAIAEQKTEYAGRIEELDAKIQEKEGTINRLREDYSGTEDEMQDEISSLRNKVNRLESKNKALTEEFEEPALSYSALLLKADMQYMLAKDCMNENATDTAKRYLNAAISFCDQAIESSDEEGKSQIQEKMTEYQDTLKMLEEQ